MSPNWLYVKSLPETAVTRVLDFPDAQLVSIDQLGNSENMAKATEVDIGIGNIWTISMWVNPNAASTADRLVEIQPDSGGNNIIRATTNTTPGIGIFLQDSSGSNIKDYRWDGILAADTWSFLVWTWEGTNLTFYHQGSPAAPDSTPIDDTGTQTSTDRKIGVGGLRLANPTASFDGKLHSYAIWDVELSENSITELYNSGLGEDVDYASDGTNYTNSADLLHWWRLGHDSSDIGKDYGTHSTLIDVLDDATGITADDIVVDYPGL